MKHLHRYLNEFSFRFNQRECEDLFALIIMNLGIGNALGYKALIGKADETQPAIIPVRSKEHAPLRSQSEARGAASVQT